MPRAQRNRGIACGLKIVRTNPNNNPIGSLFATLFGVFPDRYSLDFLTVLVESAQQLGVG